MIKPVSFFDSISHLVKISPESRQVLLSHMIKEKLPKGHILVPMGSICRNVHYLENGLTRTFYIKDNKEITERFCAENSFTCSMAGYLTNTPDNRQIELLEPSTIWSMPYTELEKLYDAHHDIERLGRQLITQDLIAMHQRLTDIQFMTAQERYSKFITAYPSLSQRISLGHISSYLGITQETLSRIRSKAV
jgi:CRP-like cAMP-binding protein